MKKTLFRVGIVGASIATFVAAAAPLNAIRCEGVAIRYQITRRTATPPQRTTPDRPR